MMDEVASFIATRLNAIRLTISYQISLSKLCRLGTRGFQLSKMASLIATLFANGSAKREKAATLKSTCVVTWVRENSNAETQQRISRRLSRSSTPVSSCHRIFPANLTRSSRCQAATQRAPGFLSGCTCFPQMKQHYARHFLFHAQKDCSWFRRRDGAPARMTPERSEMWSTLPAGSPDVPELEATAPFVGILLGTLLLFCRDVGAFALKGSEAALFLRFLFPALLPLLTLLGGLRRRRVRSAGASGHVNVRLVATDSRRFRGNADVR